MPSFQELNRLAVDVLVAGSYVDVEAGTRNSNIHRSVRPYRERDDLSSVPLIGGGTERTGQESVFTCPS